MREVKFYLNSFSVRRPFLAVSGRTTFFGCGRQHSRSPIMLRENTDHSFERKWAPWTSTFHYHPIHNFFKMTTKRPSSRVKIMSLRLLFFFLLLYYPTNVRLNISFTTSLFTTRNSSSFILFILFSVFHIKTTNKEL
jgi:hypothetical protein